MKQRVIFMFYVLVFLCVFGIGCGKPAEQASPVEVKEKEYSLPPAEHGLATTSLLKLTPEQSQISIVIPSLGEGVDKLVQVAKRFYGEDEVNNWVRDRLTELANFAGVPEAKTLMEIAQSWGFDITVPVGAFLDIQPSVNYIASQLESPSGEAETAQQEPKPIRWEDVTQPNWALALGISNAEKVKEAIKELVVEIPEISATAPRDENVKGIKIVSYGPYGYFILANYVVLGSMSTIRGVAERFADPYPIRYGSPELPAPSYSEGVILVKDWQVLPMVTKISPALVRMSPYAVLAELKFGPWNEMLDENVTDPIYFCFSIHPEDRLEIRSMMDISKRPKYASILGEAQTLYLPTLFSDATQGAIVLQLTKEYKTYLTQTAVPRIKESLANDRSVAQGIQYASSGMGFIGSEIGLCVTGPVGDFPAIVLAIRVSNVEQVTGLLNMLVPTMEDETYREIAFKKVAVPSPIPITMVMVQDLVLVSNNVDVLKKMVDLVLDKGNSNYLESLKPPVDNSLPRYSFISLQSKLFLETIFPLMSILGKDLGDAQADVQKVLNVIRELRIYNEKKGNLLEGKVIAYMAELKN